MDATPENVTRLLKTAADGDRDAAADLLRVVYDELRNLAKVWLARTPPGQTLQPTALVHEAFVRLVGRDQQAWENRGHFFFAASRAMRDILIERARSKGRLKRGGGWKQVDLDHLVIAIDAPSDELLALDEVLQRFESQYPWEHRIVMLRFFAGLTNEETADTIATPLRTVERDWRFARAWLHQAITENDPQSRGEAP